jgi:hypothetical protein
MPKYHGACHCGLVTFEVDAEITSVLECNCSLCCKKGALYHPFVEPEQFRLLSGEDALSLYQFNTRVAKHYFCKHCGIHLFHRHKVDPDKWGINVRCLENLPLSTLEVFYIDRANEDAVEALKQRFLRTRSL